MASPAAVLSILVEANTGAANANLAKTDAALRGTAAAGTGATTATSKASSAMKKMGTVAKYAGAAIGVAFAIEAKKAVTTTQDLTKSTLSLHKNLGLSNKAASEWAGLAKARGADTTKLGMAFKTLASQISAAGHGSATSIAMFKELGFSQKDIQKSMTDTQFAIGKVSDGLNHLPAGADKATFSSKLFGRGWQTIAPILRDGSAAMQEQLDTVEKYGGVLQGKTLKQQEELLANIRENKIAWQGFQVTLASAVTPALNVVSQQFQRMAATMADPKLTDDEKFKRVANILEKDFSKALDVIVKMIPTIASRVGEQAPKIAAGLVKGFLDANVWGKLLIGSWLISKMGGAKMVVAVGKKIGGWLGLSIATSTAAETEAGSLIGAGKPSTTALGARMGGWLGPAIGAAGATGFLIVFHKQIEDWFHSHHFTLPTEVIPSDKSALNPPKDAVGQWNNFWDAVNGRGPGGGGGDRTAISDTVKKARSLLSTFTRDAIHMYGDIGKHTDKFADTWDDDWTNAVNTLKESGNASSRQLRLLSGVVDGTTGKTRTSMAKLANALGINLKKLAGFSKDTTDVWAKATAAIGKDAANSALLAQNPIKAAIRSLKQQFGTLEQAAGQMSQKQRDAWQELARQAVKNGDLTKGQLTKLDNAFSHSGKAWGNSVHDATKSIANDNADQRHQFQTTSQSVDQNTGKQTHDIQQWSHQTVQRFQDVIAKNKDLDNAGDKSQKNIDKNTGMQARDIKKWADNATRDFKSVIKDNRDLQPPFDKSSKKVKDATGDMGGNIHGFAKAVAKAYQNIKDNTNKGLGSFGAKKITWDIKTAALQGTPGFHQAGGPIEAARGMRVPGSGSGDTVPAMLEPGEYVVNRKAVAAVGKANLDALNFAQAPRFAKGGAAAWPTGPGDFALGPQTIPPIQSDPDHQDHVHVSAESIPWLIGVGHKIQQLGNIVGEFQPTSFGNPFHFGPVTTSSHAHYPTDHYSGHAIDINDAQGVEGTAWETQIANVLKGGAGAVISQIAKVLLQGPDGPLKDMGQGAIDKVWKAANAYLAKHAPSGVGMDPGGPANLGAAGWHKVGATEEGLTGQQGAYGTVGGMGFAELLLAGENAGMHPNLSEIIGYPGVMPPHTKIGFEYGGRQAIAEKNDIGSGQAGNPHYVVDIQAGLENALGWHPNADVNVKHLKAGGLVQMLQEGGMLKAHTGGSFNSIGELVRALQGKSATEMQDPTRRFTKQIKGMDIPEDLRKKLQDENWQMFLDDDYIARIQQMYGSDNVTAKLGGKTQPEWMQTEAGQMLDMATKLIPKAQKKVKDMVKKLHDKFEKDLKQWAREFKQRIRQAEHDRINKIQRIAPLVDKKYSEIKDLSADQLHALAEARLKDFPQKSVQAEMLANKVADIDKAQINRRGILSILTGNDKGDIGKSGGIWGVLEGEIKHLGNLGIKGKGKYDPQSFDSLLNSIWGLGPIGAAGGATSYGGDLGTLLSDLGTLVPSASGQPAIPTDWKKRMQGIGIGEHNIQKLLALITMTETSQQEPWSPGGSNLTPKELILQLSENKDLASTYGLQANRIGDLENILKAALPGTGTLQKDFLTGAIPNLQSALQTIVGIIPGAGALGATQEHIKSLKWQLNELLHPDPANQLLEAIEANISLAGLTKGPGAPGGPTGLDDDIFWTGKLVDYWTKALAEAMSATPRNWATIGEDASSLSSAKDSLASLIQSRTDTLAADTSSGTAADAARADLLAQQLLAAQQALIVSQSQYPIFSQFSGLFAKGGTIPAGMWGIAGERGPEMITGPANVYASAAKKVPIVYAQGEAKKLADEIAKAMQKMAMAAAVRGRGDNPVATGSRMNGTQMLAAMGFVNYGTYSVPGYINNNPAALQNYLNILGTAGGVPSGLITSPRSSQAQPVIEVHINGTDISDFVDVKVRGATQRNISYARRRS